MFVQLSKYQKCCHKKDIHDVMLNESPKRKEDLMKRKAAIRFGTILVLLALFSCSVNAMGAVRLTGNSTAFGQVGTGNYTVYAKSYEEIKEIEAKGTLYQKGWFGTWKQVSNCVGSSGTKSCIVTGSFDYEVGKEYRLDYSATFYYTDGQSETLTGSTLN